MKRNARFGTAAVAICVSAVVASCGTAGSPVSPSPSSAAAVGLITRLAAIDDAVSQWQSAPDAATARTAAEEARNLVVGPAGPFYGDGDSDGTVVGASAIGLLPGSAGEPGLATPAAGACVERDVLGGSWANPAERWTILETAIDEWGMLNNTFPALPSHPQRIVGWATLALATTDLAVIHEYAGHARLHIDISMQAATACAS